MSPKDESRSVRDAADSDRTQVLEIEDLSRDRLLELLATFAGEALVHYGLWFASLTSHYDGETALGTESRVMDRFGPIALRRLAPHLGLEMDGHIPKVILDKTNEELIAMLRDIAKTWLASDGIWFQDMESRLDMGKAKVANDFCWSVFGRMEAIKIKRILGMEDRGGLDTLERALKLRLYTSINPHEAVWEDEDTLVWRILSCRVQNTRHRKGLEDYPCKSAGIAEYTSFALGVDPMIRVECVHCPPDHVPEGMACEWRFTMRE